MKWKPDSWYEHRLHTMLITLIDTGARIDEIFTLKRGKLDFDDLLLTVKGKGNKERILPGAGLSSDYQVVAYKLVADSSDVWLPFRDQASGLYDQHHRVTEYGTEKDHKEPVIVLQR